MCKKVIISLYKINLSKKNFFSKSKELILITLPVHPFPSLPRIRPSKAKGNNMRCRSLQKGDIYLFIVSMGWKEGRSVLGCGIPQQRYHLRLPKHTLVALTALNSPPRETLNRIAFIHYACVVPYNYPLSMSYRQRVS